MRAVACTLLAFTLAAASKPFDSADSLTPQQCARAITNVGSRTRLWRVLRGLRQGRGIAFSVLGGSISAGSALGVQYREHAALWHSRVLRWLNASHPVKTGPPHRRFNGAIPASTPAYVDGCLSFSLPPWSELVIIEYSVNTADVREYEALLRHVLQWPTRPAVLLLHMFNSWPTKGLPAREKNTRFIDASRVEADVAHLAQYYGVPAVSMRPALFHQVAALAAAREANRTAGGIGLGPEDTDASAATKLATKGEKGARARRKQASPPEGTSAISLWEDSGGGVHPSFMGDRVHLSSQGHAIAGKLVASHLSSEIALLEASERVAERADPPGLLSESDDDDDVPAAPLLYPKAQEEGGSAVVCVRGKELLDHTISSDGWEYAVEGTAANPKPGLIARNASNKALSLCWRPPAKPAKKYRLLLGYLKSWDPVMGTATASCAGLCSCADTRLDGRAPGVDVGRRVSLHHIESIALRVRAAAGKSSGRAGGDTDHAGCCRIELRTTTPAALPPPPPATRRARRGEASKAAVQAAAAGRGERTGAFKFKLLSYYITSKEHTGRQYKQSIMLNLKPE